MKKIVFVTLSLFFYSLPSLLSAGVYVISPIVRFPAESTSAPMQDFYVVGTGTAKTYAALSVSVLNGNEQGRQYENKVANPAISGIVVSPMKLAIHPNEKRRVRVVLTIPQGKVERRYKVQIRPVKTYAINKNLDKSEIRGGVILNVIYNVIVIVPPAKENKNFSITRKGKKLLVENKGNVFLSLAQVKQCKTKDKCQKVGGYFLVSPGKTVTIDLPQSQPVTFEQRVSGDLETVTSD